MKDDRSGNMWSVAPVSATVKRFFSAEGVAERGVAWSGGEASSAATRDGSETTLTSEVEGSPSAGAKDSFHRPWVGRTDEIAE